MATPHCPNCGSLNLALDHPQSRRDALFRIRFLRCRDCHDLQVIDMRNIGDWHDQRRYPYRDMARKLIYDMN